MTYLYFFGLAISVRRYDYGNSELNFAISWLRALAEIAQSQVLSPMPMRIKGVEIASCASQLGTIVQPTNANLNVRSMLSVFCINAYYNAVSNVAHA
jgi:hypothetical protein